MTETVKDGMKVFLFARAATAFWSGNHFIARALRESIPPVSLAFLRWAAATAVFLPFALPGAVRDRRVLLRGLPYLALTALLG